MKPCFLQSFFNFGRSIKATGGRVGGGDVTGVEGAPKISSFVILSTICVLLVDQQNEDCERGRGREEVSKDYWVEIITPTQSIYEFSPLVCRMFDSLLISA